MINAVILNTREEFEEARIKIHAHLVTLNKTSPTTKYSGAAFCSSDHINTSTGAFAILCGNYTTEIQMLDVVITQIDESDPQWFPPGP